MREFKINRKGIVMREFKIKGQLWREVLAKPNRVWVQIDYENNAATWWNSGGADLWEKYARLCVDDNGDDEMYLSWSDASAMEEEAAKIPGWSDGPEYAQHPLLFLDPE